ncbi:NUDIX domain-containing protein [Microbacterium esteraromaticum]|uniref:NUDIX domain-containing protein n=1 Tax=Microbacterium esteraromaticum TaxID=57043 RepID=UPI0019D3A400|nr:NUDIX domain-containing protein [Microbacterium esteraromaticum]MBN7792102.1 NUDIX hydrolase [Microbacterium esteraromaticum]
MSIIPPAPGEPRRPQGPRNPGDAWVVAETGEKYWGRFGAAGLLAVDPVRGVLLQHRVGWSHFGGTWGLPGGALHEGESALVGAIREAQEEAGVPDGAVRARFTRVLDLKIWSYTTVVADVVEPFEPVISDPESLALEWVPVDAVDERPLHPGFADAWPALRALLAVRPSIVVDAANVIGSVPDGWWRDRAGAAERLRDRLVAWAAAGVEPGVLGGAGVPEALGESEKFGTLGEPGVRWYPDVTMVVEGAARKMSGAGAGAGAGAGSGVALDADGAGVVDLGGGLDLGGAGVRVAGLGAAGVGAVGVVRADGHGDDAIVGEARRLVAAGREVIVVTSDRELRTRVEALGARTQSAGWMRDQLDARSARRGR